MKSTAATASNTPKSISWPELPRTTRTTLRWSNHAPISQRARGNALCTASTALISLFSFRFPQAVTGAGVKVKTVDALELRNLLERLRLERSLALESMQDNPFEEIA